MSPQLRLAASAATALALTLPALAGAQGLDVPAIAQARGAGILDDKPSRSAAEKKLADKLLFAHRAMQRGARRDTVTNGVPGFVQKFIDTETDASLATYVSIRASSTVELAAWLPTIGATDVKEHSRYGIVNAVVPVASLLAMAARPEVISVGEREVVRTHRYFPTLDARRKAVAQAMKAVSNTGPVTWQGVTAHRANIAHQAGITGAGVKVCVLSDGVASLASRQAAGELPAVDVLATQAGAGDEGTAMLEIVADMAPGASLGFATGVNSPAEFANNIRTMQSAMGCHIIVDDIVWLFEAAFNDDIIAAAVNDVTAAGVLYFASAGNGGNVSYGNSGTYEGDFVPSPDAMPKPIADIETGVGPNPLHQFPSGLTYTKLAPGTNADGRTDYITLKWSDASNTSVNDYDLFVMDSTGTKILGQGANYQGSGGQPPYEQAACDVTREQLDPTNKSVPSPCDLDDTYQCSAASSHLFCFFPADVRIYIVRYAGATRALHLDTSGGVLFGPDRTGGATVGHNAAASAITVGATSLFDVAGASPFTFSNHVTFYSSDGPRKLFYSNNSGVIAPITPGNLLFMTNGGTTLPKVDLTASDCGATSVLGFDIFCGTSAAAPSAAAIAALVKSAKPSATRAQVTAALANSAIDIASGFNLDGAGIVMAPQAVLGVLAPLTFGKSFAPSMITAGGTSTLTITVGNTNAVSIVGVGFTDMYPTQIKNAATPNAMVSGAGCTASLVAGAGDNNFAVTNATIPAGTTCTFTVAVTSTIGGFHTDSSGTLTSAIGLTTNAPSAMLTVDAPGTLRAFVSALGSDANTALNCGFANPCRSFAWAQTVLVPGGEIIAITAGGYGAITIAKPMSIIANPGVHAGITAASVDAITVATPGKVLLRGLNLNSTTGGATGINATAGASLTIDRCTITGFATGVWINAIGAKARVSNTVMSRNAIGFEVARGTADVVRSRATDNDYAGFLVQPPNGETAALSIVDSFASGSFYGFAAFDTLSTARLTLTRVTGTDNEHGLHLDGGNASAVVSASMFTQNSIALDNSNGTLKSFGDNLVDLNSFNTSGVITPLPGL